LYPWIKDNIKSIIQNNSLSQISKSIGIVDSIGTIIDSLNMQFRELKNKIRQEQRMIKQLQSNIVSSSYSIQKLIVQNCQLSRNKDCNSRLYNQSNDWIRVKYRARLKIEKLLFEDLKTEIVFYERMEKVLTKLNASFIIDSKLILLLLERRIAGIAFKMKRSNDESTLLIKKSQARVKQLTLEVSKLKKNCESCDN